MTDEPYIDFDGDGSEDEYSTEELDGGGYAHTSEDGEVAYDYDGDGLIDELHTDEDGNGSLDTVHIDETGDGIMDSEESLEEEPADTEEPPADTTAGPSSGMPLGYLGGEGTASGTEEETGATEKPAGS